MERAAKRFRRSTRSSRGAEEKQAAEFQWFKDVSFTKRLETIVGWCASKGIEVSFGKKPGGTYHTSEKRITIVGRASPEKQVYMLLHECGHHLVGYTEEDERFGMGYPHLEDSAVNTTFHHKLACLEEEIEAWNRGWRLAKRLGLGLDRGDFDRVRLACLKSYVRWANGRWKFRP